MQKLTKLKTFRFDEDTDLLLNRLAKYRIESRFVRKAIREKFERDYPKWIEEEKRKQELIKCPF